MSTYPPDEQRERWDERADELDMGRSEFVAAMVEAGMKEFDRDVEPDFTKAELKQQRSELLEELNQARERISRLEEQVYQGERQIVLNFIEDNPSAEYWDIMHHLNESQEGRLTDILDFLTVEGEIMSNGEGQYFPKAGEEE